MALFSCRFRERDIKEAISHLQIRSEKKRQCMPISVTTVPILIPALAALGLTLFQTHQLAILFAVVVVKYKQAG
jgi:hypothetical protein